MLVNCPQCGRSIESPAAGRSRTVPLIVCPCCGKFALRAESTEGTRAVAREERVVHVLAAFAALIAAFTVEICAVSVGLLRVDEGPPDRPNLTTGTKLKSRSRYESPIWP